jgi:hypothetical protein
MPVRIQVLKFEMTDENLTPQSMPMEIMLPKFLWLALAARAKAQGVGLEEVFQEVFEKGLSADMNFGVGVEPANIPATNAPGGSA